ncbi:MAG: hypothetical protein ABFS16_02240 [Bacteroidota bacterium]
MLKNFILIFIAALFILSCDKYETDNLFDTGKENIFRVQTDYQSANKKVMFSINKITDSRCPSDVWCVWQGEAVVEISVKKPELKIIELSTYNNLMDTVGNYVFGLTDVSPYPVSTETISQEDYEVTLKIERL